MNAKYTRNNANYKMQFFCSHIQMFASKNTASIATAQSQHLPSTIQ